MSHGWQSGPTDIDVVALFGAGTCFVICAYGLHLDEGPVFWYGASCRKSPHSLPDALVGAFVYPSIAENPAEAHAHAPKAALPGAGRRS